MKQVLTQTSVLLLTTFAMGIAFYVSAAKDLFILSCIFLGLEIVFSFLVVFISWAEATTKRKAYIDECYFFCSHFSFYSLRYLKSLLISRLDGIMGQNLFSYS